MNDAMNAMMAGHMTACFPIRLLAAEPVSTFVKGSGPLLFSFMKGGKMRNQLMRLDVIVQ